MKSKIKIIGLVVMMLSVLISLIGCSNEEETTENTESLETTEIAETTAVYKTITPDEAVKLMEDESVYLVDVREQDEYDQGHIGGSILLPLGTIKADAEAMFPDYDQTIIVYCRSGNRSKTGANTLLDLGYTDVYDLGGIVDWPYEIVKD